MAQEQSFWAVECAKGDPELWVCMSCLGEAFRCKVPMPDCPTCHGVSTYEAFTLESISDWGTEELIAKANKAMAEALADRLSGHPDDQPTAELAE